MLRKYNYLLFWIYKSNLLDDGKEKNAGIFWSVIISGVVLYFTLRPIVDVIGFYIYYPLEDLRPYSKNEAILVLAIISLFNYYFFFRKRSFLKYNFSSEKKKAFPAMIFIVLAFIFSIITGSIHREKVLKARNASTISINKNKFR